MMDELIEKVCAKDPRAQAMMDIIFNIQDYPADQDEDFLAVAMNLGAQIKGLCESERLARLMIK